MRYLTGLFLLWLASCSVKQPFDPETLRLSMGAEPDNLNPLTASDAYASQILNYVNDSLIERNKDTLEYEPKLAEKWEISPDHLQYTFTLKKNVTWHDGVPLTADDIIYTFQKIQDPKVEAPFLRVYYADIDHVDKIDDYTVRFVYKKPYFLGLSVCGGIPIIPKHVFDNGSDFNHHEANRKPIGTGPFKFVEWRTNKKIVLERFDNYYGPKPHIKRIVYQIISDDTVVLQILKKGELDMASIRPIQWKRQTATPAFENSFYKLKYLLPGYNYIGWNAKNPLFSDKRVRTAMTHLINRQKLLEKLQFGQGVVIESPFFMETAQCNRDLPVREYNVDKAKALLTEAGIIDSDGDNFLDKNGQKFEFTFLYPSASKFTERMVTILKEDLDRLGITMNIERMEWAAFLERIEKRKYDVTSLGWSMGFEDDPYQLWHSSQSKVERGSNFVSFENLDADKYIENARTEFDVTKRNNLYKKFQEIVYDENPYTFLFSNYSLVAVSKRFGNVKIHKTGVDPLEWTVEN